MKTLQPTNTNAPLHLTSEEMANPKIVLEEFHDYYGLNSVRNSLLELIQVALTSNSHTYNTGQKRDNLLQLQRQVIKLVEATNLLNSKED